MAGSPSAAECAMICARHLLRSDEARTLGTCAPVAAAHSSIPVVVPTWALCAIAGHELPARRENSTTPARRQLAPNFLSEAALEKILVKFMRMDEETASTSSMLDLDSSMRASRLECSVLNDIVNRAKPRITKFGHRTDKLRITKLGHYIKTTLAERTLAHCACSGLPRPSTSKGSAALEAEPRRVRRLQCRSRRAAGAKKAC